MIAFLRRHLYPGITASEAGRLGARAKHDNERKRIRDRTRQMREEIGLAPSSVLGGR